MVRNSALNKNCRAMLRQRELGRWGLPVISMASVIGDGDPIWGIELGFLNQDDVRSDSRQAP